MTPGDATWNSSDTARRVGDTTQSSGYTTPTPGDATQRLGDTTQTLGDMAQPYRDSTQRSGGLLQDLASFFSVLLAQEKEIILARLIQVLWRQFTRFKTQKRLQRQLIQ